MDTISNRFSYNSYDNLNATAKANGFALSGDDNFLLIRQREGSQITRTLVDISKLSEVQQKDIQSRLAKNGNAEDMTNLKKTLRAYVDQLKTENNSAIKTVEYKSYSFASTKAAAAKELQRMMGAPMENEGPIRIKINETDYAIPTKAITEAGADPAYVTRSVQHGQKLLNQINTLAEATDSSYASPITSRQDMVDLIWALDAEAWKVDAHYQSGSSSMYVSGAKIYDALANAKQGNGKPLCYTRGGKNDSSHLKPFPDSKRTQMGFDAYPEGQSAEAERAEKLPYGRNTLLFGKLSKEETGFKQDRTFIKLENFGTGGFGNMVAHGIQYVKKTILGLDKSTKENDFNEKTNSVSKMVSSFVENRKDNIPKNMSAGFQSGLQSASQKGLTSLAKFIAAEKANSNNEQVRTFLEELENSIGKQLEGKTLKDYQKSAIDEWKAKPGNEQKSTLAYFMEHDQSGKEIILDLPNGN